jgi:hypothetical protein
MSDFSFRAEGVDVEQIMRQIRARIREKRGVDYTEQQIHELATAKLERFLDPKGVRSDLLERYRQHRIATAAEPPAFSFEPTTLADSDKPLVRFFRRLFRPLLKLLFNYNAVSHALATQAAINQHWLQVQRARDEQELLAYEVMHNLVLETTRLGIDVKNMKMRVESIASRLEFNERRARALEAVVQFRPDVKDIVRPPTAGTEPAGGTDPITGGDSLRTRRRRRRRGRRSGQGAPLPGGADTGTAEATRPPESPTPADAESASGQAPPPHVDEPGAAAERPPERERFEQAPASDVPHDVEPSDQ